ncbi:MAG: hypothetical protein KF745_01365 [Phycisphaeraceae bacterium]|nr:hypothetical protein [Phycisphaeraceae bacterium]
MDTTALRSIDGAFAHALYDAVIRRWLTLTFILNRYARQPMDRMEPAMQAVLLAGAAQLMLMDRVPAHGAINQAVEWAKRSIRPGSAGLVNAVLRRVAALRGDAAARRDRWTNLRDEIPASDGSARVLTEAVLPEPAMERASAATGLPMPVLASWIAAMGPEAAVGAALHTVGAAPVILNVAHARAPLGPAARVTPHSMAGAAIWDGDHADLTEMLSVRTDVWVQDPASALAVAGVAGAAPKVAMDLCAGQGTKTRQLAATFPEARVIATDVDDARRATLRRGFEGHARVTVVEPGEVGGDALRGAVDLILLDVPCSNTGVLSRRLEAKYRFEPARQRSMQTVQRSIVEAAVPMLRPRTGMILYSTCSLEREENEAVCEWAVGRFGLTVRSVRRTLPAGGPGHPDSRYHDGSFSAWLVGDSA